MTLGYLLGLKVTTRVLTGKERDRRFSVSMMQCEKLTIAGPEGARSKEHSSL